MKKSKQNLDKKSKYIIVCDIGTTTVKGSVYNCDAIVCGRASGKVNLLYPSSGFVEICPHELWETFVSVIKSAILTAGISVHDICSLGICTQRGTFITWDGRSSKPLHNFITWKDIRTDKLVNKWNDCFRMKANLKVKWILENNEEALNLAKQGLLFFGTVDTWLIYKLTGGQAHATDVSNASGTAIYDPFIQKWSTVLSRILVIPSLNFPKVMSSIAYFGTCSADLFGAEIPITAVVSDQGASMYGGGGFGRGCVKLTLGTGAFLNVNTGCNLHTSVKGIYPVLGWKDEEGIVCMAEGSSNDNGTVIDWGKNIGLYNDPSEIDDMVKNLKSTDGVYFIPGFHGLQAPVNDPLATGGFLGLKTTTSRNHMVKAMVDAIIYRIVQMFEVLLDETDYELLDIIVDGGVSQSDYIMQKLANLTGKKVIRHSTSELSSLGCCFLAGLGAGVWKSRKELLKFVKEDKQFIPSETHFCELRNQMKIWENALDRFRNWYSYDDIKS